MLGELLGDLVGELIVKPFFEFVCYWTGKPVVRLLSLGRLHVSLSAEADRRGTSKRRWYSATFTRGGRRYVDPEAVCLVGLLVWVAATAAVVLAVVRG